MRTLFLLLGFCLIVPSAFSQESVEEHDFPRYPVPDSIRLKSTIQLPAKVNLSTSIYFPAIFEQYGYSCNQSGSIGYLFTYEINRLRNADASLPENRYLPLFAWNFLNNATYGKGVSYFDSWEIIKAVGTPSEADYANTDDLTYWMSGYDRYYRAMKNRVLKNWSLPVGTPEDLQVLKRYLYDHLDGSKFGGMANVQIASGGMNVGTLPKNSYAEGASYITTFGTYVGHCLTIVGYNDSIRLDRNGDGLYTNNVDINGDRVVDLKDYEKGALIVANSWGDEWGDRGFAYVPYHLLAYYGSEGGFWNKSVHIIEAAKSVDPILTMRVELSHACRSNIRIMAGLSNNPDATEPEYVLEFPIFNYQGAAIPLSNTDWPDSKRFELGLDISPLVDYVNTDGPVRIFLMVDEKNSWANAGTLRSMMVYNNFNFLDSTRCEQEMVPMKKNSRTLMSVVRKIRANKIEITEVPQLYAKAGAYVSLQMTENGAVSPYVWEQVPDYQISFSASEVPEWPEGVQLYDGQFGSPVTKVDLPFKFRFYDKTYDHFSITDNAEILFDQENVGYPYAINSDLVFLSQKKINGYGEDLGFFMPGSLITWYCNDTIGVITWNVTANTDITATPVKIVCEVHPDGRVRFVYSRPDLLFTSGAVMELGASNGDNLLCNRVYAFNPDQVEGANCLQINPYLCPENIRLDKNGWLFCQPQTENALYQIRVRVIDKNGRKAYSIIRISTVDLSTAPLLSSGYPNPFSDKTFFRITVAEKANVQAEIYDLRGRKIASLGQGEYEPAAYTIYWDGTNGDGTKAVPGIYVCHLIVGDRRASCKVVKMR